MDLGSANQTGKFGSLTKILNNKNKGVNEKKEDFTREFMATFENEVNMFEKEVQQAKNE